MEVEVWAIDKADREGGGRFKIERGRLKLSFGNWHI